MKRSRESTTALVKEVCAHLCPVLAFMFIISSTSVDFYCVMDGDITATAHVKHFRSPCILCILTQWRYDQTTATYLLLLSKKQRGKPVRLRPEPTVCEDSCSPLHQGIQVRLGTTTPKRLCSFSGLLTVFTTACSSSVFMTLLCTLHIYCFPVPDVVAGL